VRSPLYPTGVSPHALWRVGIFAFLRVAADDHLSAANRASFVYVFRLSVYHLMNKDAESAARALATGTASQQFICRFS